MNVTVTVFNHTLAVLDYIQFALEGKHPSEIACAIDAVKDRLNEELDLARSRSLVFKPLAEIEPTFDEIRKARERHVRAYERQQKRKMAKGSGDGRGAQDLGELPHGAPSDEFRRTAEPAGGTASIPGG